MRIPKSKGFVDASELLIHFGDHASDFSARNKSVYEAMADNFLMKAKTSQMHECVRRLGDRVRFDKVTNEFAVISPVGFIRTYYIPKRCSQLPRGTRRVKCHNFPTNLDYVLDTCVRF